MNRRSMALAVSVSATALLVAPAVASAKTVSSELRVEAAGDALDPGVRYSSTTARVATSESPSCSGTDTTSVPGPTALGVVDYAAQVNQAVDPLRAQSFSSTSGLFTCRIGDFSNGTPDFDPVWLYKLNHREPTIGADQFELEDGDQVLWFLADFAQGVNTGRELELRNVPSRARPGDEVEVKVVAYNSNGVATALRGAIVRGGSQGSDPTDASGETTVRLGSNGTSRLRATKGRNIPSAPEPVCVNDDLDRCAPVGGEWFVGSQRADRIEDTSGADTIGARGGNDVIDVEVGGVDRVGCGAGDDTVIASPNDAVSDTCEEVL